MEPAEPAAALLNLSRAAAETPRGEFNLSGLPEAEGKPLFGIGIDNFITLIVFGLIFTLGVLGNTLVITVLARSKPGKRRSTTNIFILNLSIADLAYLLFCIPFQSTVYVLPTWVLGAFICKFIHYFFTISMLVSIFTLSAMSVDRYVAIVHSRRSSALRVPRNAMLGVGLIWALSFAMASPVAHHQRIFHRETSNQTFCWEFWPNPRHKKVYVICTFVFGYLLPLLLISFCYAKVGHMQFCFFHKQIAVELLVLKVSFFRHSNREPSSFSLTHIYIILAEICILPMDNNAVTMYRSAEIYEIMLCLVCTDISFLSSTSNIGSVLMQIFPRGVEISELRMLS
uniref:G-protein coupled receptors family 1 profile domain-containing protein n=1 Tax=Cyanistes caeruleus TaxID=156563 RepID=A0A8C0ZFS9_CYACU